MKWLQGTLEVVKIRKTEVSCSPKRFVPRRGCRVAVQEADTEGGLTLWLMLLRWLLPQPIQHNKVEKHSIMNR